jgi:hypothetical protein
VIDLEARTHGLVDILDRVLDKGLVIAGDIKINLSNVERLARIEGQWTRLANATPTAVAPRKSSRK